MTSSAPRRAGRHFLQIPGPTNVPDRVLRAIDFPTMDHRGPEFALLGKEVLANLKRVFKSTQGEVVIYPASGTGAWEAALVNTLSAGDRVLMYETGHFATLWQKMAAKLALDVEFIAGDWRRGADTQEIEKKLQAGMGILLPAELTRSGQRRLRLRMRVSGGKHAAGTVGGSGGFSLEEISVILDDPDVEARIHLRRQHRLLQNRIARLQEMACAVEYMLEAQKVGMNLTPEEKFEVFGGFDPVEYTDEVEQRWGKTDA